MLFRSGSRFDPNEPLIRQFWEVANEYTTDMKRKLLLFITGTDRIPATGIQNMAFKISYLGEVCFNIAEFESKHSADALCRIQRNYPYRIRALTKFACTATTPNLNWNRS